MRPSALHAYVAAVAALAAGALAGAALLSERGVFERPWLVAAFAAVIVVEHLFATQIKHDREHGETTTHEESFVIAMAFLLAPLDILTAVAVGFLGGNVLLRREPLKATFNVAAMVVAAGAALAVIESVGGADPVTPRALVAVAAGAVAFVALNRILVSAVLTLAGAGRFSAHLVDDLWPRTLVSAANASIGLLAGLAAAAQVWTLPVGLLALVALHFAFTGHARARADRQKLADLVSSSSDGIVSVDASGRVRSWNPASEAITGYPADRVLGRTFADVWALIEAEPEHARDDGDGAADGESGSRRIRTAGGETRWIRISRAPLPEGGAVLVVHDESTRRQVDEIRVQQEREQLRADFVATVSHELRTPLTSILGFAQTLLTRHGEVADPRQYLGIIVDEAKRLQRLIDDLLDLRQMAAGGFVPGSDRVDVAAAVADEVATFVEQTDAHRIALDSDCQPLWVRGDARRLRQVVANLISNAIKYSPEGGEITVSAHRVDGAVRVAVRDRGIGIPADQQRQIFTRFFRARSATAQAIRGTGLGLALSRAIVESHGGRIAFESTEGEGSTFYFELPSAGDAE